jgi:hypothetical protein
MRGLIAGSSHVRRLEQFILNRPSLDNFSLIDGPEIHFYGISGGQISRSNDLSNISSKIQEIQPKHLILVGMILTITILVKEMPVNLF